ncbi:MAG: DUF1624 domain-containing protein [Rhizobiaceae bacterium]|nr:DUF1624 domain-containing protein [Rhizobiaceae bacterium]
MAIYHFAWDLEFFGYAPAGMAGSGGWKLFARCIASSFLFLVGVSLVLGHGKSIRWKSFWRRWVMVAAAALAITVATYIAMPNGFIFFGILHQIALASVLGLAFLRLPAVVTLSIAVVVLAAPHYLRSEFFDAPWWWWSGLSINYPRSNDYVPVFPWFGAVLIGIAAAKIAAQTGLLASLSRIRPPRFLWPLDFAGRHSLAVYLIHQPVLIACVWLFSQVVPPNLESLEVRFLQSCERTCVEQRDTEFCARYCVCVLDRLESAGVMQDLYAGRQSDTLRATTEETARQCTIETDDAMLGEEGGP